MPASFRQNKIKIFTGLCVAVFIIFYRFIGIPVRLCVRLVIVVFDKIFIFKNILIFVRQNRRYIIVNRCF